MCGQTLLFIVIANGAIQMLHDLAKDDGYVAIKRAAGGHRKMESQRKDVINLLRSSRLLN